RRRARRARTGRRRPKRARARPKRLRDCAPTRSGASPRPRTSPRQAIFICGALGIILTSRDAQSGDAMIRLLLFLAALALAAYGLTWLAENPGEVALTWGGVEYDV